MDTNNVTLVGRLVRDPEKKTYGENKSLARFTLALNTGKNKVSFINITAFGKLSEIVMQFLSKGKRAAVTGSINSNTYTNKEGVKRTDVGVVANTVQFLDKSGSQAKPGEAAENSQMPEPEPWDEETPSPH